MSATIDTNIVQMKFDNKQFEENCKQSMDTLEKLKQKIDESGSGKALDGLNKASKNVDLSHLSDSIEAVNKRFSLMGIAGMTAISEITKAALNMAKTLITAVPNQIKNGGWTRAMNIENARFQLEGLGIAWSKVGDQITSAVQGTAYGMDSAAKAASQLAAAGVDIGNKFKKAFDYDTTGKMIDEMEMALSAISGVAAQTNSNYDDIARIFMQVSATGKLMTQDMNQIAARGVNVTATLAQQLGKTQAEIRDMVSKGQISFQMFSEAMYDAFAKNAFKANDTFNGAMANMLAALSKTGERFAGPVIRQMIPVFNSLRLAINKVNDEINIFSTNDVAAQSQAKDALKESVLAIKTLEQAKEDGSISTKEYNDQIKDLNKNLEDSKQAYLDSLGPFEKWLSLIRMGFTDVIDDADFTWVEQFGKGIANIGKSIQSVLEPIAKAFGDTFGEHATNNLQGFANAFEKLTAKFRLTNKEMGYLRITFRGLFDIMEVLFETIGDVLGALIGIDTSGFKLRENILFVTAVIGTLLTKLANLIRSLNIVGNAITGLKMGVGVIAGGLYLAANAIYEFGKEAAAIIAKSSSFSEALHQISDRLKENIQNGKNFLKTLNPDVFKKVTNAIDNIKKALDDLGKKISENTVISKVLDAVPKKLETIKQGFKKLGEFIVGVVKTIGSAISSIFGDKNSGITKTVTIVDDAVALAGPVQTLSATYVELGKATEDTEKKTNKFTETLDLFKEKIDAGKIAGFALAASIAVIGIRLSKATQSAANSLDAATKVMKTLSTDGVMGLIFGKKQQVKPNTLRDIAILIGSLAASLFVLAQVPADKLKQAGIAMAGISGGILVMLGSMTAMQKILGKGEMLRLTTTLITLSGAVAVLSGALYVLSKTEGDIVLYAKVMAGLATAITALGVVMARFAPALSSGSLSLVALAGAMYVMVGALKKLNNLEIDASDKGLWGKTGLLVAVTGSLVIISGIAAKLGTNSLLGIVVALASLKLIIPLANSVADAIQESVFAEAWRKLRDFFIGLPEGWQKALAGIAAAVAIIGTIIGVAILFKKVVVTIKNIGGSITAIGKETSKWQGISKALSRLSLVPVIIALTGMFAALAGLTYILGKMNPDALKQGATYLAALSGMITVLVAVSALTKNAKVGPIMSIVIAISTMFAEIVALSVLVDSMGTQIGFSMAIMAGIVTILATLMAQIGTLKVDKTTFGSLVVIAATMAELVGAIALLTLFDFNKIMTSVVALSSVMMVYTVMIQQLGKTGMSFSAGKQTALLESTAVIAALGLSLAAIATNDWQSILAATVGLSATMFAYTGVLSMIGQIKLEPTALVTLAAMTVSMLGVAASLAIVAQYDWTSILAAAGAMAGTMAVFGVIVKALGSGSGYAIAGAFAMDLIAAAAYGLAKAFEVLLPPLTDFIPAIKQLFVDVLEELVSIKDDLLEVSIGIVELGAALTVVGGAGLILTAGSLGLYVGADSLMKIVAAGLALQAVDTSQFVSLAKGLTAIGAAGIVLNIGAMGLISGSAGLSLLALALTTMARVSIDAIAAGLVNLIQPMVMLGPAGIVMLTGAPGVLIMAAAVKALGIAVAGAAAAITVKTVKELSKVPQQTAKMGFYAIKGYAEGLTQTANSSGFKNTITNLANFLPDIFRKVLGIHSPSKVLNAIGKYVVAGYYEGMTDEQLWNGIKDWCKGKLEALIGLFKSAVEAIGKLFGSSTAAVNTALEEAGASTEDLSTIADDVMAQFDDLDISVDDVTEDLGDFSTAATGAGGSASSMSEEVDKSAEAYENLRSKIESSIKYFEEFDKTVDVSKRDILKNMQSQIDGVMEWTGMLSDLQAKGLSGALLEYLANLGPDGYKYVAAFEDMTLEELAQANQLFATEMMLDEASATSIMNSFALAGDMVAQGFITGLTESQQGAVQAVALMGSEGLAAFNAAWDIHSPSRKTFDSAVNVCKGFVNGIKSSNPIVHTQVVTLGIQTLNTFRLYFNARQGHMLGTQICNGLISGLISGQSGVISAAVAVATAAYEAAKATLDIHSPSKKFEELGLFVDKGFANGIDNGTSTVVDATRAMADNTVQMMNEIIRNIASNVNNAPEFQPVIRPELDLTALQNGKARLAGMFNNPAYEMATNLTARMVASTVNSPDTTTTVPSSNQTIIFNQTNNSPKNIDPYESYRLTRLGAEQMKGVFR